MWEVHSGRQFIGRLEQGCDLLETLNACCRQRDIRQGLIQVIGAVERACFGFYEQRSRRYLEPITIEQGLEILFCAGNISLLEGVPQAHLHILLGDVDGAAVGGHLHSGTRVFNAEVHLQELVGTEVPVRSHDPQLGAPLWPLRGGGD